MEGLLQIFGLPYELYGRVVRYVADTKSTVGPDYVALRIKEAKISGKDLLEFDVTIEINPPNNDRRGKDIPHPVEVKLLSEKLEGLVKMLFPGPTSE